MSVTQPFWQYDKKEYKFNPQLTEDERKFVISITEVGQHIKDQETVKEILRDVFKLH